MLGHLYDPKAEFGQHDRMRPHWTQAGAIVFITARTQDSIPSQVLAQWEEQRASWIDGAEARCGIPSQRRLHWKDRLIGLDSKDRDAFHYHFNRLRETELDRCHGDCWLRDPAYAEIVYDSLLHFDGERYRMGDFIVMPNHFHVLVAFGKAEDMEKQIASWLHWTATLINRKNNVRGHFWQQEPFDHLVRNIDQYVYLRKYIAANPKKANLKEGEYLYRKLEE